MRSEPVLSLSDYASANVLVWLTLFICQEDIRFYNFCLGYFHTPVHRFELHLFDCHLFRGVVELASPHCFLAAIIDSVR